jgi:hypothetical protein
MPPQAGLAEVIRFHRNRANHFHGVAKMRHHSAAVLARQALQAQQAGRPVQARKLMQSALRVKAAAGRAGLRARNHRLRVAALQQARRAAAQPRRAAAQPRRAAAQPRRRAL